MVGFFLLFCLWVSFFWVLLYRVTDFYVFSVFHSIAVILSEFQIVPSLANESLKTGSFSSTAGCPRLTLYTRSSRPRISCFSKKPWFFSVEMVLIDQALGARGTHHYWLFNASRPFQRTELERNIHVYLLKYVYIKISYSILTIQRFYYNIFYCYTYFSLTLIT